MSKQNKANKSNYDQAGRLTPDEMARERQRQRGGAKAPAHEGPDRHEASAGRGAPDARKANQLGRAHDEKITGRARESEASSRRRNEREE